MYARVVLSRRLCGKLSSHRRGHRGHRKYGVRNVCVNHLRISVFSVVDNGFHHLER